MTPYGDVIDQIEDSGTPEKKRKSNDGSGSVSKSSGRRALSCTECKRRKTKCSALGQTPCDACIKRKRPEDCYWEDVPHVTGEGFTHPSELAADVKVLRREVQELRDIVNVLRFKSPSSSMAVSIHPSPSNASPRIPAKLAGVIQHPEPTFEVTLDNLENSTVGPLPGSRPERTSTHASHTFLPNRGASAGSSPESGARSSFANSLLLDGTAGLYLINVFFIGPIYKGWYAVEEFSFRAEYEEYCASTPEQRAHTDVTWLSLAYMILSLAVKFSPPEKVQSLLPLYSPEDIAQLPDELYHASVAACNESDCMTVPQIRHIQVSLLYAVFLFHFGKSTQNANMAIRHLDSAITTAQWLGLDRLGDRSDGVPLDDPSLSLFNTWAAHEICKRLFHMLSFLDGTIAKSPGTWRLGSSLTILNSVWPGNYLDIDFHRPERPPERPFNDFTRSTLPRVASRLATAARQYTPTSGVLSYVQVLEFDQSLRNILASIPNKLENPSTEEALRSRWMMHHIHCSLHNRLLRIHRPYLIRGYLRDDYEQSRLVSVNSAKSIVQTQLLFISYPRLRPRFVKRWILSAAMILTLDYFLCANMQNAVNRPKPNWLASDSRNAVLQALEMFRPDGPMDETPSVSRQCAKTLEALLAVADSRSAFQSVSLDSELQAFFNDVKARLAVPPSGPSSVGTNGSSDGALGGLAPDLLSFDTLFPPNIGSNSGSSDHGEGEELRELWNQWIAG